MKNRRLGQFRSQEGKEEFGVAYAAAMAAMPVPDSTANLPTSYGVVRAYTWLGVGHEPAVLLLPGMRAGAAMWAENLPGFRQSGRTVIAVDALGDAGMSVQTAPLRSAADQARWLGETLTGLDVLKVHVVGHSFGGATAAGYAVRSAGRVASLTLIEPVFTLGLPPLSTFAWAALAGFPVPGAWRDHALAALGGVSVAEVRLPSTGGTLIAVASHTFASSLPTPRPLSAAQMSELSMPTYVALASRRSLAGRRAAPTARAGLQNGTVEIWPDTTHSLPMQVPRQLAGRLQEFWAKADLHGPNPEGAA